MVWAGAAARGESGYGGWLRYARLGEEARARDARLPAVATVMGGGEIERTARGEIVRGVRGMLGRTLREETGLAGEAAIVLATREEARRMAPWLALPEGWSGDGYWLKSTSVGGHRVLLVAGASEAGVLYGAFALLRRMALGETVEGLDVMSSPRAGLRWVNQWDNLDGTIERGYAGRSIFFEGGHVAADLGRVRDYARLLASVGVNGCAINNVNANPKLITAEMLPEAARVAEAMRPWGVRMAVSVDFGSPRTLGGLETFDPKDARVAEWWKQKVDELYRAVPDLAGLVVKADSEGRAGPSAYGRTQADAANVIARALAPHGGVLVYRAFVYDHHADWRNLKNDRARAAYDNFHPLDGSFDDNVVLQIKHGPIDFQAREPVSPLLGGLRKTNEAIELQITQEYTGQQRHLCYLAPMWKGVLDFDLESNGPGTTVKEIVSGKAFGRKLGGYVGVANVGRDSNWMGYDLAMANLYAFGRLAWDADLTAEGMAREWAGMTFGTRERVAGTVAGLLMDSWRVFEEYTGPLGAGTLTDILHTHYGPDADSSERNGWGQWHRADREGMGMDRTVETGTGYTRQYAPGVGKVYESLATCPDELLLFFHHVPWTYRLHSGKTVIQHIYDVHYRGAAEAAEFPERWRTIEGMVDEERYRAVLDRLEYQAGHAAEWRDDLNAWFLRMSGIADERGRIGHEPGRVEAEGMKLSGYEVVEIHPVEAASGGKAVACGAGACRAGFVYRGEGGWKRIGVQYFDENDGVSRFRLLVNGQEVGEWKADRVLPSREPDANTASRKTVRGIALRPGDEVVVEGEPEGGEKAVVDYVEVGPEE